jgi:cobalt-zinc-cadmium efflux system protein
VRALAFALALTAGFMGVELGVGLWSGSLALVADAGHMLADAGALALALLAQQWGTRPRSVKSTFGYRRAEVLAAFVNGIALAVTALWIVSEAVERWMVPQAIRVTPMLVTASLGLAVNGVVAWILVKAQKESVNARAAFLHVLTDAVGSLGAIAAGIGVAVFDWPRADPLLSVGIAALVAFSGWRVIRETTGILLEAAPGHLDVAAIERAIIDTPGVADAHDLHVWRISDRFDAVTVHVTLERGAHGVEVSRAVAARLARDFQLEHVTVQPEAPPPDELVPLRRGPRGRPVEPPDG